MSIRKNGDGKPKIFLDDIRNPPFPDSWTVIRSYEHAVQYVKEHGVPSHISFDHDLGDQGTKTGHDFAKWLVEYDMDYDVIPEDFTYAVHSANPPGANNIRTLLRNYLEHKYNEL